jgi:hypothetical protein
MFVCAFRRLSFNFITRKSANPNAAAPQQSSITSLNWPLRLGKKLW